MVSAPFRYLGSAAGLFLFRGNFNFSIYVCNPVTGKFLTLPPMALEKYYCIGGIVQEGDGYKVVVLHEPVTQPGPMTVAIYDSTEKAWRIAGRVPVDLRLSSDWNPYKRMVFSGGFFYCLMVLTSEYYHVYGILGFNMGEGTSLFVELPEHINNLLIFDFTLLLSCRSRILLVTKLAKVETRVQEVIVWEFNRDNRVTQWNEIARMPDPILNCMIHPPLLSWFECVGVEDCLYFKRRRDKEFAVYSLTQNSWTWLPNCPFARVSEHTPLLAFEPRPDMKVE